MQLVILRMAMQLPLRMLTSKMVHPPSKQGLQHRMQQAYRFVQTAQVELYLVRYPLVLLEVLTPIKR